MEVYTRVFALDMAATLAVPSQVTGGCCGDPAYTASPEVTAYALPYISCGQQNIDISWSMYML
ncbi:hypothetical protein ECZU23_53390 [Escherichia coli]|nr:hypothetical protein ECZU23_53390 [Escherichia coli]